LRGYELCLIIHPDASDYDIETMLNGITDIITRNKGTALKTEKWGKKSLKFTIKKQTKGIYCFVYFTGTNTILREIDRSVRYNESILRYATLALDKRFSIENAPQQAAEHIADAAPTDSSPAPDTASGSIQPEKSEIADTQ
jgi:small subunit ribosomal protein S6